MSRPARLLLYYVASLLVVYAGLATLHFTVGAGSAKSFQRTVIAAIIVTAIVGAQLLRASLKRR